MSRPLAMVLALLVLTGSPAIGQPAPPVRVVAEWEPATGTLISWPLGIPQDLVVELARDDMLYVLVTGQAAEDQARHTFQIWGVEPDNVEFIHTSVQTHWPRDWGPHQVFDGNGRWAIVDPVFEGYPWVAATCQPISSPGGHAGDDAVNADIAGYFGADLHPFPGYLTGGNFLVDGHEAAFSTCAMVGENQQLWSEAEFLELAEEYLGIQDYRVLDNTENYGIQHIDCWLKPLDEETLLVKRAPAEHEEYDRIRNNLKLLAMLQTRYGRPYRIVPIDTPAYDGYNVAAYANTLILNRKVLVPLFGVPGDADALATFEAALPGYQVIGYPWGAWYYYDALHCRVRAIFDRHMLRITHGRLSAWVADEAEHEVTAFIDDRSEAGLVAGSLRVYWRPASTDDWNWAPLETTGAADTYRGAIPAHPPGTTVEYYLAATDQSGRSESSPPSAPDGFHAFTVGCEPVTMTVSRTELSWNALDGAIGYDVVAGEVETLHRTGGDFTLSVTDCLADDRPGDTLPHAVEPLPGRGAWFLVRAVAPSGQATYSFSNDCERNSRDALIDVAVAACP